MLLLLLHDVRRDLDAVAVLDVPEGVLRVDGAAVGRVGVVGAVGRRDDEVGLGRGEEPVRLEVVVAQVLGGVHALVLDAAVVAGRGVGRRLLRLLPCGGPCAVDDCGPLPFSSAICLERLVETNINFRT